MRKLLFEFQKKNNLFLLHGDMFPYCGEKILNLHIMEQTIVNVAAGIAYTREPVLIYGVCGFIFLKALEQIKFNLLDFASKYAPILWFNAGHTGCYNNFGKGHIFDEEMELCKLYGINVYTPEYADFLNLCDTLLRKNGLHYIRLGEDHK